MSPSPSPALIIGAGIGGLATAIRLQLKGYQVQVFEASDKAGGKLNEKRKDEFRFDAGPSLFTLPNLVSELFELAGKEPEAHFSYEALPIICRYFYPDGTVLNAFREIEQFLAEIAAKTEEKRATVAELLQHSSELYDITAHVFLERSLHQWQTYLRKDTLWSMLQVHKLNAFQSLAQANQKRFSDPKVAQLFNRYATYNGSDPYQAPATLNIIPHLEHNIGAFFPKGGMYAITQSLYKLAQELGVEFHFDQPVDQILYQGKKVSGIQVGGKNWYSDLVVSNMDIVPTYRKLLPSLKAPERTLQQARSSSALIFYWGIKGTFPSLELHNIFFSGDYAKEFHTLWKEKSIYQDPTVYLYISSKHLPNDAPAGHENWFCMINVPADTGQEWDRLVQEARKNIIAKLEAQLNTSIEDRIVSESVLDPRGIASKTSSYQGALYGSSSNTPWAAFMRHANFSTRLKGLYFCGGSVHPGGGIPLCLLSAKIVGDMIANPT